MAYSTTDLSAAAQTTAATAGKPFVLPAGSVANGLSEHTGDTTVTWSTTATAVSDITETGYPTSRLWDTHNHLVSRPSTTGYSIIYLLITTEIPVFDTIFIGGHNLHSAAGAATLTIQIADNAAFSSNLRTLVSYAGFGTSKNARLCFFNIGPTGGGGAVEQYSDVVYLRIKIDKGSSFTIKPEIGEIVFAKREQLSQRPDVPFDDEAFSSSVVDFHSKSGVLTRYVLNTGQRFFKHQHSPTGADAYGMDDITSIRDWYKNTKRGVEPFIYVPDPTDTIAGITGATSNAFVCQFETPSVSIPLTGPTLRNTVLDFAETAPFVDSES
jgi:hypothetical protein